MRRTERPLDVGEEMLSGKQAFGRIGP